MAGDKLASQAAWKHQGVHEKWFYRRVREALLMHHPDIRRLSPGADQRTTIHRLPEHNSQKDLVLGLFPPSAKRRLNCVLERLPSGLLGVLIALLVSACAAPLQQSPQQGQYLPRGDADKLLIVDCLLPGQVRKLGNSLTYLSPRRPAKITADDCEIRGGEYVAYDRANYATALQVWLAEAEGGDPKAQTYVGEIYERGLGRVADPALAVGWYQKAATQGYARAQINLGSLYERGLGTAQDKAKALNLYRAASGLSEDPLAFSSEIAQHQAESERLRAEVLRLQGQLDTARRSAEEQRLLVSTTRRSVEAAHEQLAKPGAGSPESGADQQNRLKLQIHAQEAQLVEQERNLAALERRAAETQAVLGAELTQAREDQRLSQAQADLLQQRVDSLERQLASREAELEQARQSLTEQEQTIAEIRLDYQRTLAEAGIEGADQIGRLQGELDKRNTELARREAQLGALQDQMRERVSELSQLEDLELDVDALSRDRESLNAQVEHYRQKLTLARDDQLRADRELELRQAELDRLEARLEQRASADDQAAQAEISRLQSDVITTAAQAAAAQARIADLEAALSRSDDRLRQLEEGQLDRAAIERERDSLAQQVSYQRSQLVANRDELQAARAELERERAAMDVTLTELERRQNTASALHRAELQRLQELLESRNAELVQARAEFFALETQVQVRQDELSDLQVTRLRGAPTPAAKPQEVTPDLPQLEFGRYHALVIGNDRYAELPILATASNDAKALASLLESRYGFSTEVLLDANRYTILSALNGYREKLTSADNFLLYYAGHGELDAANDRSYWLPVDAGRSDSVNWISNVQITDILNSMEAKHVMVIADSCYSGQFQDRAFTTSGEGGRAAPLREKWLRLMIKTRSRTVITSGGTQPVLDSGGGSHSLFAGVLLDELQSNRQLLEGPVLFGRLATRVKGASQGLPIDQSPEYAPIKFAGDLGAPFFFRPARV